LVERAVTAKDGVRLVADVYGAPSSKTPVVCVPGLTRNAKDFTELASRLAEHRLVVAVDLRGRGRSGRDPSARSYTLGAYASDMVELADSLALGRPVWVGTSLGGLVSMQVGSANPDLVAGIVLNDIGPELAPAGVARIQSYAGRQEAVASWSEAVAQVREVSENQTPGLSDEEWLEQARMRYRETPDGRIAPDYDPGVVSGPPAQLDPWSVFERLTDLPVLVLRGELSDLLSAETVRTMEARHPGMQAVEVPGRGHAPLLTEPAAAAAIDAFLGQIDHSRRSD
jgi:pimeloyl-ACP methyl ester carboxylesterase